MPAALALLPAIIGAGGAIGGALLGGKQTAQQKQADTLAQQQLDNQKQITNFLTTKGGGLIDSGISTLQGPLDYYNKLLSGDRTAASGAVGPALSTLKNNQFTNLNNILKFSPRGGARGSAIGASDVASNASLTNILQNLKPMAISGVTDIGKTVLGTGSGLFGQGAQSNAAGTNAALNFLNTSNAQAGQQNSNMAGVGSSLGTLLALILHGGSGGGGGAVNLPSNGPGWNPGGG